MNTQSDQYSLQCKYVNSLSNTKISKYFIAANVNGKSRVAFIDTGADISLIPQEIVSMSEAKTISTPFTLRGFDNKVSQTVDKSVNVNLDFGDCEIEGKFYICKTKYMIIGCDLLRDPSLKMNLETKTGTIKIDNRTVFTDHSPFEALQSLKLRIEDKQKQNENDCFSNWAKLKRDVIIPPFATTSIRLETDQKTDKNNSCVFLSLFDNENEPLAIPSVCLSPNIRDFQVIAENCSTTAVTLKRGSRIGRVAVDGDAPSGKSVCIFDAEDIATAFGELESESASSSSTAQPAKAASKDASISAASASAAKTTSSDAESAPAENDNKPIPLSELIETNKVNGEILQKAHKNGIEIDIELTQGESYSKDFDTSVDINEEIKKSSDCKYWPSDEHFLSQFNLDTVDEDTECELKKLLLKFKHVFFNPDFPQQFHEGIRVPAIKMRLKENHPPPPKDRPRRMNEKKLSLLKEHLKSMKEKGIIKEHTDYGKKVLNSPAHIVIESRYLAAERRNITKSRFVLDQRFVNQIIEPVSNSLPLCDEFRRNVAQEGFTVFSNLDCADFFYQFKTEYDDAEFLFGFTALGRNYIITRLSMGCTNSPGIAQAIIKRIFASHPHAEPFLDDLTVISKTMSEHLKTDLPLAMALCSKFNLLLKPTKADLARPNARILGFDISRSTTALSQEKIEKIRNLTFPETKKEALSRASFFAYFISSVPKLSELMEPLRRLARPNTRFKPTDEDRQSFEKLKEHLLNPVNGVIRMPSSDLSDTIIVWTDSSQNSLGALITQKLFPLPHTNLEPTKRHLTIIGCWSRLIDPNWSNYPIWYLELLALEETTRKYRYLLEGRQFFVMTDSSTVRSWASLELVPVDISRRILRLQQFNFKILFVESRINPSDWTTRISSSKPEITFPRFLEDRIVNANGETVPWTDLFCDEKFEEATGFFQRSRRQNLAEARDKDDQQVDSSIHSTSARLQSTTSSMESSPHPSTTVGRIEAPSALQSTSSSDPKIGRRKKASTKRQAISSMPPSLKASKDSPPSRTASSPAETTRAARKKNDANSFDAIDSATVAAFGLDDEEIDAGVDELLEDAPINEDVFDGVVLPTFDWADLTEVLHLQTGDKDVETITDFIETNRPSPDKTTALSLSLPVQQFLRHRSNFKLSTQQVLYRLWTKRDGTFEKLIVVGEEAFKKLIKETHTSPSSALRHLGKRKTFTALNKTYFAFAGRKHVQKIIASCPNCALNRFHKTRAEKTGNQLSLEPNSEGAIDVLGPLASFGTSPSTGRPRYVGVYVDLHSRYAVAKPMTSIDDAAILDVLIFVRDALCGFPRRLLMDNAIAKRNTKSAQFLREMGIKIVHGMATISRCQSKVERTIQTLTRLMCKLHTDNSKLSFTRLVAEACIIYNTSPSDGLANGLSPKDLHFAKAPATFPRHSAQDGTQERLGQALQAARLASKQTVLEDVKRFMKRQKLTSPTDYTNKLKVNDLCLRKRTSFASSSPKKLAFRINIDAYKITSKVATNSFRAKSLVSGLEEVLPGDVLIKVTSLGEEELRTLVAEMEGLAARNAALSSSSNEDGSERPRRSARIRARREEGVVINLVSMFSAKNG